MPDFESMLEWLTNVTVEWAPKIALAVGIFVIGRMIVRRLVARNGKFHEENANGR